MNNNRYIIYCLVFVIVIVCALVGYGIYLNVASSEHVSKMASAQYARVRGAKVAYQEINPTIYIPSLSLTSAEIQDVHNQIDGTLTSLYVKAGDKVKKGQLICELTNNELPSQILQMEGNINRAQASYTRWSNTAKRYELLTTAGAISPQQMEEAIANRDAAAGDVAFAEAQRNQLVSRMNNQKIFAPQDSVVIKVYHAVGTYLGIGQSVIMLGNFTALNSKLNISNEDLVEILSLSDDYKLAINTDRNSAIRGSSAYLGSAGASYEVDVDAVPGNIDPPLSTNAQYRSVIWQINNKSNILEPGTYYQAKLYNVKARRTLAIPYEALLQKNETAVFVISENQLEQRNIRTGSQDDKWIEVVEGLNENEVVVISGKLGLSDGMRVRAAIE